MSCGNPTLVSDTRGGCYPKLKDADNVHRVTRCTPERGGAQQIESQPYELTVENPPDNVCRDEDGNPILVDGLVQYCA